MAHALAMRATSLVASAALLGAAVIVAMSATWAVQTFMAPDPPTETSIIDMPPPPPEPQTNRRPIEPPPPLDAEQQESALQPLPPTETTNEASEFGEVSFDPGPVTIENPRWLQRPRNLARYYPRRALAREIEGTAVLDCLVSTGGQLSCRVLSETPAGWDFGEAALRMAADHRMVPATRSGQAVEGRYRMRVPFNLD